MSLNPLHQLEIRADHSTRRSAGNFDGLAIVIDQYGGSAGKIRGFLNDGGQNFRSHGRLASLAFGHCDYAYRNLGRPSKLRVSSHDGLKVSIDDQDCFSSDKISLPSGYYFGLTAGTADQPDSFEIQRFVVSDTIPHEHLHTQKGGAPPNNAEPPTLQKLDRFPGSPEAVPDRMAEEIKSQDEQFADLHNRLQSLTHQVCIAMIERLYGISGSGIDLISCPQASFHVIDQRYTLTLNASCRSPISSLRSMG